MDGFALLPGVAPRDLTKPDLTVGLEGERDRRSLGRTHAFLKQVWVA